MRYLFVLLLVLSPLSWGDSFDALVSACDNEAGSVFIIASYRDRGFPQSHVNSIIRDDPSFASIAPLMLLYTTIVYTHHDTTPQTFYGLVFSACLDRNPPESL